MISSLSASFIVRSRVSSVSASFSSIFFFDSFCFTAFLSSIALVGLFPSFNSAITSFCVSLSNEAIVLASVTDNAFFDSGFTLVPTRSFNSSTPLLNICKYIERYLFDIFIYLPASWTIFDFEMSPLSAKSFNSLIILNLCLSLFSSLVSRFDDSIINF